MLARVVGVGKKAAADHKNATLLVATEDDRIKKHCDEINVECIMTPEDCATGSDRVLAAAKIHGGKFDVLLSLQGDAPFTPANAISAMLDAFESGKAEAVATPVARLRWSELDALRQSKETTPFSGTTAIIDANNRALWFSKNILPAIRDEKKLRDKTEFSPVYQHLGLYAYRTEILEKFVSLPQGHYEKLEGLEQLRLIENHIPVHAVIIDVPSGLAQAGIDSPEDVARAEILLAAHP